MVYQVIPTVLKQYLERTHLSPSHWITKTQFFQDFYAPSGHYLLQKSKTLYKLFEFFMIHEMDIAPLGFDTVLIDSEATDEAAKKIDTILTDHSYCNDIIEKNFKIGIENLSFENLEMILRSALDS